MEKWLHAAAREGADSGVGRGRDRASQPQSRGRRRRGAVNPDCSAFYVFIKVRANWSRRGGRGDLGVRTGGE